MKNLQELTTSDFRVLPKGHGHWEVLHHDTLRKNVTNNSQLIDGFKALKEDGQYYPADHNMYESKEDIMASMLSVVGLDVTESGNVVEVDWS